MITNNNRSDLLPVLAGVVANIFWGFSYLFIRLALRVTEPEIMLSLRFITATILMLIVMKATGQKLTFKGKTVIIPMLVMMVAEPAGYFFESYAILFTNATMTGISMAVVPIFAILMAAMILKEYPARDQVIFGMIPVIGVIIITVNGSEIGVVTPIGLIFLICTCMCYASYRTANRKASLEFSPAERSLLILVSSAVVFTIASMIKTHGDLKLYLSPLKDPKFLLPMLTLSVFCSIISNLCANYSAEKLSVLKYSVIGTITTIVSTFSGVIFLHEPMTSMMFVGALMIIFGITKVTLLGQKEKTEEAQTE